MHFIPVGYIDCAALRANTYIHQMQIFPTNLFPRPAKTWANNNTSVDETKSTNKTIKAKKVSKKKMEKNLELQI